MIKINAMEWNKNAVVAMEPIKVANRWLFWTSFIEFFLYLMRFAAELNSWAKNLRKRFKIFQRKTGFLLSFANGAVIFWIRSIIDPNKSFATWTAFWREVGVCRLFAWNLRFEIQNKAKNRPWKNVSFYSKKFFILHENQLFFCVASQP